MPESSLGFYIYQFVPVTVIEALILKALKWGGWKLSFLDALMMNFASFAGLLLGLGPYIASSGPWGLTLYGTYSFMVEAAILMLLERHHSLKKVLLAALAANFASCLFLLVVSFSSYWHKP